MRKYTTFNTVNIRVLIFYCNQHSVSLSSRWPRDIVERSCKLYKRLCKSPNQPVLLAYIATARYIVLLFIRNLDTSCYFQETIRVLVSTSISLAISYIGLFRWYSRTNIWGQGLKLVNVKKKKSPKGYILLKYYFL